MSDIRTGARIVWTTPLARLRSPEAQNVALKGVGEIEEGARHSVWLEIMDALVGLFVDPFDPRDTRSVTARMMASSLRV